MSLKTVLTDSLIFLFSVLASAVNINAMCNPLLSGISLPENSGFIKWYDSLMLRFNRFRSDALRTRFFGTLTKILIKFSSSSTSLNFARSGYFLATAPFRNRLSMSFFRCRRSDFRNFLSVYNGGE